MAGADDDAGGRVLVAVRPRRGDRRIASAAVEPTGSVVLDERLRERRIRRARPSHAGRDRSPVPRRSCGTRTSGQVLLPASGRRELVRRGVARPQLPRHAGREHSGEEVVVVADEVVVYLFRYVLERLTEAEVLGLGRATDLANCSVTQYELGKDEQGSDALGARRLQPGARRSGGDRRTGRAACATLTPRARVRSTTPCWPSTSYPTSSKPATRWTVVKWWSSAVTPRRRVGRCSPRSPRCGRAPGAAHVIVDETATTAMAVAHAELRVSPSRSTRASNRRRA